MRPRRLLIIDDEPEIGALIGKVAEACGYSVSATEHAAEFKSLYDASRPDVIILDLAIPGTDGVELLRFLADKESQAQVLIISGLDRSVLEAAQCLGNARGLNVAGVITKPLRVADLRVTLGSLCDAA